MLVVVHKPRCAVVPALTMQQQGAVSMCLKQTLACAGAAFEQKHICAMQCMILLTQPHIRQGRNLPACSAGPCMHPCYVRGIRLGQD